MPEESNIRQATPPKGLLTKSLEGASGLSPKQQIARAYEDDLSGKRGPEARFDALNELIGARVSESMDNMIFSSGDGTQIAGKNGFFTAKSAPSKGAKSTPEDVKKTVSPWDLAAGEADGSFTIPKPGRIYTSYGDASSLLTITDADLEFSLGAGDLVWLELTFAGAEATPTITLKAGSPPEGWPAETYLIAAPPATPKVTKAYFELYEGKSGTIPATEFGSQQDGFWIRKSFRYGDSILIWGTHEFTEDYVYVPVPMLVPR